MMIQINILLKKIIKIFHVKNLWIKNLKNKNFQIFFGKKKKKKKEYKYINCVCWEKRKKENHKIIIFKMRFSTSLNVPCVELL